MKYGYSRVSTKGQARDGNSLEYQEKILKEHGAENIFTDIFTGKRSDRPQFKKLLSMLKAGDTLIVTKLDRFARTVGEATAIITKLIEAGITVEVCNLGVLDNSPTSVLIRNVLLCIAQFERDMIVERTSEGKEIARLNPNFREGRPKKYSRQQREHVVELKKKYSYKQVSEMTGIPDRTVKRIVKEYNDKEGKV